MSARQFIASLLIGLLGSLFLWFAAPYNNFILANAFISDDFMPVGAVGLMLVLVLAVNPLLHRFARGFRLSFSQLALIFGILLAASITPGQGMLRHILYPIGATPLYVTDDEPLADAYKELDLPGKFFPEPLAYGIDVPASEHFVDELPEGESIPWGKWKGPLLAWGGFFGPYWLMLTAMALILLPHWRDTERQPFPLLQAQRALIENSEGRAFPPALSNPVFWIAFGAVFFLHLMSGLKAYFPDSVPAIKLSFNLSSLFTEAPARYMPWYMKANQIHFLFLGIAYFMPNRVGLSIWFFQLVYAIFIMVSIAYAPPYDGRVIMDHRIGAWIAIPLGVLWMSRRHWAEVIRLVFRRPKNDEELRNKVGGTALLVGMLGVFFWLLWVGVPVLWALALVAVLFLFALGMTRIVAETGVPLMAPDSHYVVTLANLIPVSWRTAAGMYFSGIIGVVSGHLNRLCATTMLSHSLGLDNTATPRRHIRMASVFLGIILLSVIIGGVIQLKLTYTHATTIDQRQNALGCGGAHYFRAFAEPLLRNFVDGRTSTRDYNQWGHIFFGAALSGFLLLMCQRNAKWPIHPVALLFVGNWYAHRIWFSVFLGWCMKMLILTYGGGRAYRASRNVFLGIMIGEVAAVVCWAVVAAVVAALGGEYQVVRILPF